MPDFSSLIPGGGPRGVPTPRRAVRTIAGPSCVGGMAAGWFNLRRFLDGTFAHSSTAEAGCSSEIDSRVLSILLCI